MGLDARLSGATASNHSRITNQWDEEVEQEMAFCPGCGYEYREGVKRCPDCDLDLVADLEEADAAQTGPLRGGKTVNVFTSTRPTVEMLADMLDQEGIPSMIKAANVLLPTEVANPQASPLAELHVLEQDAEDNRELIEELVADMAGDDADQQDDA